MSHRLPLAALVRQAAPDAVTVPDDELIDRFATSRDQAAFELLVWRHGEMVWGVCRRMLARDRDAAEDACQAVFVALATHGARLRHKRAIGAWLHRVAVRAALDVLASRRVPTSLSGAVDLADRQPGPDQLSADREVRSLLDAGLNRLPDRLRVPFVLRELEGRSNAEVAAALGCPIGTVESRLTHARRRLRVWLTTRGAAPAVLGATGAMPDGVRAATVRAGTLGTAVSPAVRTLADRAVRSALGAKLGTAVALALVLVATVAGFGLPTHESSEPPPPPAIPLKPVATARADAEGVPLPPGAVARLGSSRLRHGNAVTDIVFSSDRTRIASGGFDRTVRVWDGKTGRPICTVRLGDARYVSVRFTADEKSLVAVGTDDHKPLTVLHIDPDNGAVLTSRSLKLSAVNASYALSPDGSRIAVCETGSKGVRVFDTTSSRELWRAKLGDRDGFEPAYSPDGRTLAVPSGNGVCLFDSAGKSDGRLTAGDPNALLTNVVLSPDGNRVAACWMDTKGHMTVWNRATGRAVWSRQFDEPFCTPQAFSPDGKWLVRIGFASEAQRGAMVMDASNGKDKTVLPCGELPGCARFRPDGTLAVGGQWGTIRPFDPMTGKALAPSPDPPDGVEIRGFSPDGRTLFGWSEGCYAWDIATGRHRRLACESSRYDALSPDGTRVVRFAGEKDSARMEICDAETGKILRTHRGAGFGEVAPWGQFTPDGKSVIGALADDGTTRIWAADTGKELIKIAKEPRQPGPFAVSANAQVLAAIEYIDPDPARRIRVWDLKSGRELAKFEEIGAHSVSVSADGRRIAVAVAVCGYVDHQKRFPNPSVTIWDVASGKVLARIPQRGPCGRAELSPDGRTVAVMDWVGALVSPVLRVYEVASGSERMAFRHEGHILGFLFSPNGKVLASASAEAPVYLWDLTGDINGPATWNPTEANAVWDDLSSPDAAKAFVAVRRLRANPAPALVLLRDRVKPLAAPAPDTLKNLFADLDSEEFAVREKAVETLAGYDEAVRTACEQELARSPSPEARTRLRALIARLSGPTPIRLRLVRAVEAVEGMGTVEADALLRAWAGRPSGGTLATEAAAALARRRP